jgi:hypothetical protein
MIVYDTYLNADFELGGPQRTYCHFSSILNIRAAAITTDDPALHALPMPMQGRDITLYQGLLEKTDSKKRFEWIFEISRIATYRWSSGEQTVYYMLHEKGNTELLIYWLLHTVLPLYFSIEKKLALFHVGAVGIDNRAILLSAASFGGKSTLTDYFIRRGHLFFSDDRVGTYEEDGNIMVVASYPYHRPYRKMEDLGFPVKNFASEPKPLQGVYELVRSDADAKIEIAELFGIEKFKALRYSSEINFSFLKEERFAYLSRVAELVPVYRVTVPWDLQRLYEVHEAIVSNSRNCKT